MYQIEIELNDIIYLIEYEYNKGECRTYDYFGSPNEVIVLGIYIDNVLQKDLDWKTIDDLTYRIEQYHEDNF